jgi:hypothetical protein
MPIHSWTKPYAWLFHDFHQEWIGAIKHVLNSGILPPDYYALAEQVTIGVTPDVLTLRGETPEGDQYPAAGGLLVAEPKTRIVETLDGDTPRKKNQIAVKHASRDQTVAVIEIVSPGNKDSRHSIRAFLDKSIDLLAKGIHLLVIDLQAPTKRDPHGIHAAVLDELTGKDFLPPPGKPLTLVSYQAVAPPIAYVEPVAVGDVLPDMPLFLIPGGHVLIPLEMTYQTAWQGVPARWRKVIDPVGN